MLPSALLVLLLSTLLPQHVVEASAPRRGCVPTGDETEINRLLDWGAPLLVVFRSFGSKARRGADIACLTLAGRLQGGRGTQVALCQNALFRLQNPILFTAEDQGVYTEGHPTGPQRAMLLVEGQNQSMAIKCVHWRL
jgi:hypothetical protein